MRRSEPLPLPIMRWRESGGLARMVACTDLRTMCIAICIRVCHMMSLNFVKVRAKVCRSCDAL